MEKYRLFGPHGMGMMWSVFKITMFLDLLYTMHAYFFFHVNTLTVNILFGFVCLLLLFLSKGFVQVNSEKAGICVILFVLAYFYTLPVGNINLYLNHIFIIVPILTLMMLGDEYKIDLINDIYKCLAYLIGISACAWLLGLLGISLPGYTDFYGSASGDSYNDYAYMYNNHFLYLVDLSQYADFSRFCFIFLEPGYTSIFIVFLLYISKFDFSNLETKLLLLGLLCTMSVAGVIMGFGAYVANLYTNDKMKMFKSFFIFFIVIISLYSFFVNYNGGDNVVNKELLSRLEWDESEGRLAGYNRTNEMIDDEFLALWSSPDLFFGKDIANIESGRSVGYKPYMIQYGLLGTTLFLLTLFFLYRQHRCYDSLILFILYIIMFSRGHHVIYYQGFWLVYICGIAKLWYENDTKLYD